MNEKVSEALQQRGIVNPKFILPENRYMPDGADAEFVTPDDRPVADIFPENNSCTRRVVRIQTGLYI